MPLILLVTLPKRIWLLFKGNKHNFWESVFISFALYFGLFMAYSMGFFVYCLFTNPTKEVLDKYESLIVAGAMGWFVGVVVSITYGIISVKEKMDRKKWENYDFNKPEKKNVIIESIKGFYNKYCPRITWK
jgi:ABC-type multidrug transport system fused ATPase/permease subunit